MDRSPIIGIHFKDEILSVQVYRKGSYERIASERAYVAFTHSGYMIGDAAYQQWKTNPTNTFHDFATIIGRSYNSLLIKNNARHWTFKLTNISGRLHFVVVKNASLDRYSVTYVLSILFMELRKQAEARLESSVADCIIVVPDTFMEAQKPSLIKVCKKVGLNVLRIGKESIASIIGYTSIQELRPKDNVFVIDTTTTPFNAFVYSYKNSAYEVKSNVVNKDILKGVYYNYLYNHFKECIEEGYKLKFQYKDGCSDDMQVKLSHAIKSSDWTKDVFLVNFEHSGSTFKSELTYARFKEKRPDLREGIAGLVNNTLKEANVYRQDVRDIRIIGDPRLTYYKFIRKIIGKMFCRSLVVISDEPTKSAVSYGAAWLAYLVDGNKWRSSRLVWNFNPVVFQFMYKTYRKSVSFEETCEAYNVGAQKIYVVPVAKVPSERTRNSLAKITRRTHWKGIVLLVNNVHFANRENNFDGAEIDTRRLSCLFTEFGYNVLCFEDLDYESLVGVVESFRNDERHKYADSCFVVILSQGANIKSNDFVLASDGEKYSVDAIVNSFRDAACPNLKGKPKIFIFDACRVENLDSLIKFEADWKRKPVEEFTECSNTLVVRSALLGSVSILDRQNGSWVVDAMCEVFPQNASENNIVELFSTVEQFISKRSTAEKGNLCCFFSVSGGGGLDFYF